MAKEKFKKKKITEEMLRRNFSRAGCEPFEIKSRWLHEGWRITTDTGGEVLVNQKRYRIESGGEDVYRAMTLVVNEAWGGARVSGSNEHIMAALAHAEVEGVNIIPVVEAPGAGCLRFFVTLFAFFIAGGIAGREHAMVVGSLVAFIVWQIMKKREERAERRRGQKYRNALPSVLTGGSRESSYEIAKRRGLI